jgi:hypothetical protein
MFQTKFTKTTIISFGELEDDLFHKIPQIQNSKEAYEEGFSLYVETDAEPSWSEAYKAMFQFVDSGHFNINDLEFFNERSFNLLMHKEGRDVTVLSIPPGWLDLATIRSFEIHEAFPILIEAVQNRSLVLFEGYLDMFIPIYRKLIHTFIEDQMQPKFYKDILGRVRVPFAYADLDKVYDFMYESLIQDHLLQVGVRTQCDLCKGDSELDRLCKDRLYAMFQIFDGVCPTDFVYSIPMIDNLTNCNCMSIVKIDGIYYDESYIHHERESSEMSCDDDACFECRNIGPYQRSREIFRYLVAQHDGILPSPLELLVPGLDNLPSCDCTKIEFIDGQYCDGFKFTVDSYYDSLQELEEDPENYYPHYEEVIEELIETEPSTFQTLEAKIYDQGYDISPPLLRDYLKAMLRSKQLSTIKIGGSKHYVLTRLFFEGLKSEPNEVVLEDYVQKDGREVYVAINKRARGYDYFNFMRDRENHILKHLLGQVSPHGDDYDTVGHVLHDLDKFLMVYGKFYPSWLEARRRLTSREVIEVLHMCMDQVIDSMPYVDVKLHLERLMYQQVARSRKGHFCRGYTSSDYDTDELYGIDW